MSRTRTPVAVKRLNGNPGKRSKDLTAGIILPPEMPKPPAWLSKEAKRIFRDHGKMLFAIGTLTRCDAEGLARYASNCVLLRAAHRQLATDPMFAFDSDGRLVRNPALNVVRILEPLIVKFDLEMGASAAARSKINIGTKEEPDDFTAEFLR